MQPSVKPRIAWLGEAGILFHGDGVPVDVEFDLEVIPASPLNKLSVERGLGSIKNADHEAILAVMATRRRIVLHSDGLMVRIRMTRRPDCAALGRFATVGEINRTTTGATFSLPESAPFGIRSS